jgi:hypothetical protein
VDRWKGGSTRRTTAVVVWSAVLTPGWSCIRLKNASPGRWHPGAFAPGVGGAKAHCEAFGEAGLAHRIRQYLPEQGQLFVGNSLVVRLIDAFRSCRRATRFTATAAPAASTG